MAKSGIHTHRLSPGFRHARLTRAWLHPDYRPRHTPSMDSRDASAAKIADRLALAVLAAAVAVVVATFRHYGLGWDDYAHAEYGELMLAFYASGFSDRRALSFVNLYMYGGGFDLLAALAAKALPFTLFETRRLVGGLVGIVGLVAVWRTARRLGGPAAGLVALVLLAACPLY